MPELGFHFAQPAWFWALLALIPVALWLWRSAERATRGPIHRYADAHLLPHLTGSRELATRERWGRFFRWSLLWALLVAAMAGPRWDYTDIRLFRTGNNLLILLDISRSMQAGDVAPSRIARARQEIEDLITRNRLLRIGLIAFASVPHVVSPITEDAQSLRNTLPALSTDLVKLQGSRLHAALDRAEVLLAGLPEDSARAILLISDGDFDEEAIAPRIRQLAEKGVRFHVLGVGTEEGAPVPNNRGGWVMDSRGQQVVSRLNEDLLRQLASAGQGIYETADYRDDDTEEILNVTVTDQADTESTDESARLWNERYYLLVLAAALMLLPTFRRVVAAEAES